jgi:hypothetical protein
MDAANAADWPRVAFAQIAPGDLDVAVIGQLPLSQLALDRQLEACPLEMEGFNATLRGRRLIEQPLEDPPRYTRTVPWYSPSRTLNSTAARTSSQWASSGKA